MRRNPHGIPVLSCHVRPTPHTHHLAPYYSLFTSLCCERPSQGAGTLARPVCEHVELATLQARDRRMLGLIEALRVQEARPPPGKYEYKGGWQQHDRPAEEDAQSSSTLSEAAAEREALLDSDTAVPSATAFSDTISAAAAAGATRDSSSNGSGSAVTSAPAQKGGAPHVTKLHPVAASEALLSLAAFGGPVFFQDEMEAIIQVRNRAVSLDTSSISNHSLCLSLMLDVCPRVNLGKEKVGERVCRICRAQSASSDLPQPVFAVGSPHLVTCSKPGRRTGSHRSRCQCH